LVAVGDGGTLVAVAVGRLVAVDVGDGGTLVAVDVGDVGTLVAVAVEDGRGSIAASADVLVTVAVGGTGDREGLGAATVAEGGMVAGFATPGPKVFVEPNTLTLIL
jgi:hypothetical protein